MNEQERIRKTKRRVVKEVNGKIEIRKRQKKSYEKRWRK